MRIHRVLCPIDFSTLDPLEIGIALEVCRTFGARLVLHHNLAAAMPGFSRAWEWDKAHQADGLDQAEAERRMRRLVRQVAGDVRAEAIVTTGPIAAVVLGLAHMLPAELIVLGSHGWSTQDHASVAERVLRDAPCPVLTFREASDAASLRLRSPEGQLRVVVPTDLGDGGAAAVAYACELARELDLRVELLHVLGEASGASPEAAQAAMDALVPPDLVDRVTGHVRRGAPGDAIVRYVDGTSPAFVVLGEHAHGLVRRFLTRDTTREVAHRVRCPVWVVPPARVDGAGRALQADPRLRLGSGE